MFNFCNALGLSNMVKITAEKHVKKLNLGSNLTSNSIYFLVLHCIFMCVALSFLFGYLLSTRCVCPQIGRAFEAPIGHKTLLCDHMLLLAPFIAYFLKKL